MATVQPPPARIPAASDLHVVFDFYSEHPQRAPPPETPECSDDERTSPLPPDTLCTEPYWTSIQELQGSDIFLEGMLLRSLEQQAKYPYVQYLVYNAVDPLTPLPSHQSPNTEESPPDATGGASCSFMQLLASQAGYREMFSFVDRETPLMPKRPQNPLAAYLVSAFRSVGNLHQLDETWSYWSGADFIVENIPKSLLLQRLTLHRSRCDVTDTDVFSYVLLCELGDALGDLRTALQFMDTLKRRECGFTSLYAIDHFF